MSKRVAIYARYSSHEQDGTSTIESQMRECKEYALKQGWRVLDELLTPKNFETLVANMNERLVPLKKETVARLKEVDRDITRAKKEIANLVKAVKAGQFESVKDALKRAEAEKEELRKWCGEIAMSS